MPNILIFMTDHQRRESMPFFGGYVMPNLTSFARDSVSFTNACCVSPHCCPSRASFFSGLFPSQHGVWNNVNVPNALSRGLAEGVTLFSENLKRAGWRLYLSGKWHLSREEGPADRGWECLYHPDTYAGFAPAASDRGANARGWENADRWRLPDESVPRREGEIRRPGWPEYFLYGENEHPFSDEEVVQAAADRIRHMEKGAPWCIFTGVLGPHDPYFVPKRFLDLYDTDDIALPASFDDPMDDKPALYRRTRDQYRDLSREEEKEALRHYMAFCSYEDSLFGRLLDALKESGQYDDTMILYLSDHGDYAGAHGLWAKGLPSFREAYSIPLMIRVPGGRRNETDDAPVMITDIAPTILEFAGLEKRESEISLSLLPRLQDANAPFLRSFRYTQTNGNELYGIQRQVYDGEWKYVYNGFDYDELYHIGEDPDELHNLAEDPSSQEKLRALAREMWRMARLTGDRIAEPYIMTSPAPFGPRDD